MDLLACNLSQIGMKCPEIQFMRDSHGDLLLEIVLEIAIHILYFLDLNKELHKQNSTNVTVLGTESLFVSASLNYIILGSFSSEIICYIH